MLFRMKLFVKNIRAINPRTIFMLKTLAPSKIFPKNLTSLAHGNM